MSNDLSRHVALTGVANFRDLGGYPTRDGRTTRWRTMFRADSLGQLTADDLTALRPIGLRTVVDLRTATEIEERGRFPVDDHPVRFHHVSVIDQTWSLDAASVDDLEPAEFLHRQYSSMLTHSGDRFADALTVLADADGVPAVFHCAAGKDRTGLLAALVLGAVGVGRDTIVEDYALTRAAMDQILSVMAADPEKSALLAEIPAMFFSAEPEGMARTLDDIAREHGTVRDYVRFIGVADDVIEHLEHVFVDD